MTSGVFPLISACCADKKRKKVFHGGSFGCSAGSLLVQQLISEAGRQSRVHGCVLCGYVFYGFIVFHQPDPMMETETEAA